jgi:hypothetical protein
MSPFSMKDDKYTLVPVGTPWHTLKRWDGNVILDRPARISSLPSPIQVSVRPKLVWQRRSRGLQKTLKHTGNGAQNMKSFGKGWEITHRVSLSMDQKRPN